MRTITMYQSMQKVLLIIAAILFVMQIQPALSYTYGQTAPSFNNFMNQQQELCKQRQEIFMQGQCFSPSEACRVNPTLSFCPSPAQTQLPPHNTPDAIKPPCNRPSDPINPPADCVPPVTITMANCHLQGSTLECFVRQRTEIAPNGTAQITPLMPPQGLEIKEDTIEGALFKSGLLVLPSMCQQSGNEWHCQISSTGQRIVIRPMAAE
jgi:hypothetical protein